MVDKYLNYLFNIHIIIYDSEACTPKIAQVLFSTIDEFNFEEQAIIFLCCHVKLAIEGIVNLTKMPTLYTISTLLIFSEKLAFKLGIFEQVPALDTAKRSFDLKGAVR